MNVNYSFVNSAIHSKFQGPIIVKSVIGNSEIIQLN